MLKISAFYFMWNPEICHDPPTCGQDDLVLLMINRIDFYKVIRSDLNIRTNFLLVFHFSFLFSHGLDEGKAKKTQRPKERRPGKAAVIKMMLLKWG
jgi:hypothetical protein